MEARPPNDTSDPRGPVDERLAADVQSPVRNTREPPASPMWVWVLPLVLVVLLLAWYVATRGEPRAPFDDSPAAEFDGVPTPPAADPSPAQPAGVESAQPPGEGNPGAGGAPGDAPSPEAVVDPVNP